MDTNLRNRTNERHLSFLDEEVRELFRNFIKLLESEQIPVIITSSWRTFWEQENLYWAGRDENGKPISGEKIFTNARAGQSAHNFRRAIDLALIDHAGNPTWDGDWDRIGNLAETLGIEWSGRWKKMKEKCHFQKCPPELLKQLQEQNKPAIDKAIADFQEWLKEHRKWKKN